MFTRTRAATLVAAVFTLALVPAAAQAQTVPMRGVVSGSPYGASNNQMAIPVLFSKNTARDAGLKSPVGVIIVKRTMRVPLPGSGSTLPVNLRTGDRFKGTGMIDALQQRVYYPRIVFPKAVVYFRSKELSLAELSAAVDSLRKSLADLQGQLNALRDSSLKSFQDIYAQLTDLRNALAALKIPAGVDLSSIQSQLDALSKKVNDLIASLPDFSKFALLSQLPDLTGYAKLTDLTGFLKAPAVQSMIDTAIAGLATQTSVTNLQTTVTALGTTVSDLSTTVTTLTSRLNTVCSALKNGSVTLDPDGAGPLPPVTVPLTLPSISTACP